jgi:hypothetical protein
VLQSTKEAPELRRTPQLVEKVGTELIGTPNCARKAPKSGCLIPELGQKRTLREFFNRLTPSTHSAE